MGGVEAADGGGGGEAAADAPEKSVTLLLGRRGLERRDQHTLWVEVAHDVGDGAVLAARVHALQHDEQRPLVLRVKALVPLEQDVLVLFDVALGSALAALQPRMALGVAVGHPEAPVSDLGAA